MSRRTLLAAGALIMVLALSALFLNARGAKACTKAGCGSSVGFDLSSLEAGTRESATAVELCVNEQCTTRAFTADVDPFPMVTLGERTVRSSSISILDATGTELARAELTGEYEAKEFTPNGPDCEPICWQLNLSIADGTLKPS